MAVNLDQKDFLGLGPDAWPARLTGQQAAWILGLEPHHLAPLVRAGLLSPLGRPEPSAPKYFSLPVVLRLRTDSRWLERVSATLTRHWRTKNDARRKTSFGKPSPTNSTTKDLP